MQKVSVVCAVLLNIPAIAAEDESKGILPRPGNLWVIWPTFSPVSG